MILKRILLAISVALILTSCSKFSDESLKPPELLFPGNGSKSVPINTTFRWRSSDEDVMFEIYLGSSKESLRKIEENITKTFHKPEKLEYEKTYYWKVVARRKSLDLSAHALTISKKVKSESEIWTFTTEEMPPSTPSNPNPSDGEENVPINTTLSWSSTDTDELAFKVLLSESSPPSLAATTDSNKYLAKSLKYETTYYWQIVADDRRGKVTKSPIWMFTTEEMPPSTPSNPNPSDGSTDVSVNQILSWDSTDTDTLYFTILLDESSPPREVAASETTGKSAKANLEYETKYYWQVIADDKRGKVTKGPLWTFTTEEMPPSTPSNPNPADGSVDIPTSLILSWNSTDTDPIFFTVFLSESSPPDILGTTTLSEYDVKSLKYETTYYWQIVVDDRRGKITKGPVWKFKTMQKPNTPPEKPIALFPKDSSFGVPINIALLWSSTDVDNDKITYDLYFGRENDPPILERGITKGSYRMKRLHYSTRYYWKVVAKDGRGGTAESDVWSFRTRPRPNRAPSCPYNPTPEDGESEVSTGVVLRWNAYDPDGDILRYDIYFGENENPDLVASNHWGNSYTISNLENCYLYYWKVIAKDSRGASSYGPVWKFRTIESSSPTLIWEKNYGGSLDDSANGVSLAKGGYVVVGSTENSSDLDGQILLVSKDGQIQEENILGGSSDDILTDIGQVENGYIVVGYTKSEEIPGYHGGYDIWVARVDSDLNLIWQKAFGGSGNDIAHSVLVLDDGIIVAGETNSGDGDVEENLGGYDGWIIKIDFEGNLIWQKIFGGNADDSIQEVSPTSDSGYIAAGYTYSDIDSNKGINDFWILKIHENGDLQWQRTFGGSSDDKAYSVIENQNGDYIAAGYTHSNDGDISNNYGGNDVWVIKVSEEGDLLSEKSFGGSNDDRALGLSRSCSGKLIVVGKTFSSDGNVSERKGGYDVWILRIDEDFNLEYEKTFGGTDDDEAKAVLIGNGYVVVGYTKSKDGDVSGNNGGKDFWMINLR